MDDPVQEAHPLLIVFAAGAGAALLLFCAWATFVLPKLRGCELSLTRFLPAAAACLLAGWCAVGIRLCVPDLSDELQRRWALPALGAAADVPLWLNTWAVAALFHPLLKSSRAATDRRCSIRLVGLTVAVAALLRVGFASAFAVDPLLNANLSDVLPEGANLSAADIVDLTLSLAALLVTSLLAWALGWSTFTPGYRRALRLLWAGCALDFFVPSLTAVATAASGASFGTIQALSWRSTAFAQLLPRLLACASCVAAAALEVRMEAAAHASFTLPSSAAGGRAGRASDWMRAARGSIRSLPSSGEGSARRSGTWAFPGDGGSGSPGGLAMGAIRHGGSGGGQLLPGSGRGHSLSIVNPVPEMDALGGLTPTRSAQSSVRGGAGEGAGDGASSGSSAYGYGADGYPGASASAGSAAELGMMMRGRGVTASFADASGGAELDTGDGYGDGSLPATPNGSLPTGAARYFAADSGADAASAGARRGSDAAALAEAAARSGADVAEWGAVGSRRASAPAPSAPRQPRASWFG